MRRSLTTRDPQMKSNDQAAVILNGMTCGDFACECQNSLSRGRGLTHCPHHGVGGKPDLNVELGDNGAVLVHCHVGCSQADVLAALTEKGLWGRDPNRTGYADLAIATARAQSERVTSSLPPTAKVAEYVYTDRDGAPLFVVERYEPKDFRQRLANGVRKGVSEAWTLYRLPEVLTAVAEKQTVFITEGERDADALRDLGLVGTTSPGGAGKWADAYATELIGATVVVVADKDEPGRAHAREVAQSLSIAARTVSILEFPGASKDAADWIAAGGTRLLFDALVEDLPEWQSSEKVIYTARDLAVEFRDIMSKRKAGDPEYTGWRIGFPSLDKEMVYSPGDVILIAGATGVGKTSFLQSLERRTPVPSIFFSAEMSRQQLMNRKIAAATGIDSWKIRRGAVSETEYAAILTELDAFERDDVHALVDNPALTTAAIESILRISRVRFGTRVAYIDYVQRLADKNTESERMRVTDIIKALSRIAMQTQTVVVAACQTNREGDRASGEPPYKSELAESGMLEKEASIILAIGRAEGARTAKLAVRKNRHGLDGFMVPLEFDMTHNNYLEPSEARVLGRQEVPF